MEQCGIIFARLVLKGNANQLYIISTGESNCVDVDADIWTSGLGTRPTDKS